MSKFSKHLALGQTVVIDGEEFLIKPLCVEDLPLVFEAIKAFIGLTRKSRNAPFEELIQEIDSKGMDAIARMIDRSLQVSYPNESPEERRQFGMRYWSVLFPVVMELNSYVPDDKKRKEELLSKIDPR